MKESTFSLLMAVSLVVVSYFDSDSVRPIIGFSMAFGFALTGTICRAIEKNGKEK